MKSLILSILLCVTISNTYAQDKQTEADRQTSKIEDFTKKSGSFLKKEFFKVGMVNGITFEVVRLTDLANMKTISGLRVSTTTSIAGSNRSYSEFLDKDEIEGFLNAIAYSINNVFTSDPTGEDVEYIYRSRADLVAGAYNFQTAFSSKKKWRFSIQIDKYSSGSMSILSTEDLQKVKEAIFAAQAKLQSL